MKLAAFEAKGGENFDADYLVSAFKNAGAGYIVPVATFHDNFDLWNSGNIGP